jgi:2-succinyl-5-enolpyruvyl-6-hydroxy-3-cyclohexene-1-carboxylate synthase
MIPENPNAVWAGAVLDEVARSGVEVVGVAPGSRSTPLVLAAAADGRFRLISVVDERSAGYFALGVGKGSGKPAAVITTSGTAGANLYPAVIEASLSEVPLLILTADRPHRLRDSDANQAVDQIRFFGPYTRAFFDVAPPRAGDRELKHLRAQACRAVALAQGPPPGPVHMNFPFEKPLEPSGGEVGSVPGISQLARKGREGEEPFTRAASSRLSVPEGEMLRHAALISRAARGLIVAGPIHGTHEVAEAVRALGAVTGFPILADPLSGAKFGAPKGAQIVSGYDLFLRSPHARAALEPDLILRVGASPTSAALLDFLGEQEGVTQVVVDGGHRWKDHLASAHEYIRADPAELLNALATRVTSGLDPRWRDIWSRAGNRVREILGAQAGDELEEGWIVRGVVEALPDGANLVVANSMPIRDLDAHVEPSTKELRVFGNRGASGIDGFVSTAIGVAASASSPTLAVAGDLSFFHDMNGLLTLRQEGLPVGFVVVNNDGGGIFHNLPVREFEPAFTRYFATPHGLNFRSVADLYGLPYQRCDSRAAFPGALAEFLASGRPFLLETIVSRERGYASRQALVAAVLGAFEEDELG